VTIVNDESMRMLRQLYTCLNVQKVFTHTPKAGEIASDKAGKILLPAMYTRIMEHAVARIKDEL
jgi:hypothetical protein